MNTKLKIAVIGYGYLGKWHCQKVEAHSNVASLHAIVEKFEPNAKLAKANHQKTLVVSDIKDIILEIDAAIIVTPTSTHFELVKYLTENNKHVFCEKPLCSSLDEALQLEKSFSNKNLILQVGHSERFHEAWEIIFEKYAKYLTAPCTIRIARFAPFKGRATDVDVVSDVMIHDLDLLYYLFKGLPASVEASGHKIRTNKYDHVHAFLKYKNGNHASVIASRNHVKEIRMVEIANKEGCLFVDLMNFELSVASQKSLPNDSVEKIKLNKRDHLHIEHDHFYNSIIHKRSPIVSIKDGVIANKMIDAVLKASQTGTEVKWD